jgi:hypothetical protein
MFSTPSSRKDACGARDPEVPHRLDFDSGLLHTVTTPSANEADVEQVADLLHGKEAQVRTPPTAAHRLCAACRFDTHQALVFCSESG